MTDEKFPFNIDFEKKLLNLLMTDSNLLIKASKYLKPQYFSTEILSWLYTTLIKYYEKYNNIVTETVMIIELNELQTKRPDIKLLEYTKIINDIRTIEVSDKEFIIKKLEEFIKRNLFVRGFNDMKDQFNASKFDDSIITMRETFEKVNSVKFEQENRSYFFEEANDRAFKRNERTMNTITRFSTGILELDAKIGGGLGRGELGVVLADAGAGKSICVVNVGASAVRSFNKVLHVNLEGKHNQVEDRYEARLLDYEYNKIVKNDLPSDYTKSYSKYSNSLIIVNFIDRWDYSVLDIEQEIKFLKTKDFEPDVVIVDYGDLLSTRKEISDSNSYQNQQQVYRDLKTLANRYNCALWSPAQCSRPPAGKDPKTDENFWYTRYSQADCYAKVRICDLLITLNRTDQESKSNKMRIYLDKFRDAECGTKLYIDTNYKNMQFYKPSSSSWNKLNNGNNN